jgi:hypothetical protein
MNIATAAHCAKGFVPQGLYRSTVLARRGVSDLKCWIAAAVDYVLNSAKRMLSCLNGGNRLTPDRAKHEQYMVLALHLVTVASPAQDRIYFT